MPENNERESVRCSFCGKPEQSVERMLHSARANICDNCVALCYEMLVEEGIFPEPGSSRSQQPIDPDKVPELLKPAEIKELSLIHI